MAADHVILTKAFLIVTAFELKGAAKVSGDDGLPLIRFDLKKSAEWQYKLLGRIGRSPSGHAVSVLPAGKVIMPMPF